MGIWEMAKTKADNLIVRNATLLAGLPRTARQLQAIYKEEEARSRALARATGHGSAADNEFDAMRHAEASSRATKLVGPGLARVAGDMVEAAGLARSLVNNVGQQFAPEDPRFRDTASFGAAVSSMRMDQHNNAEGRRAALEGRAVDPVRLKTAPDRTPEYNVLYDARAPRRRTTAGR